MIELQSIICMDDGSKLGGRNLGVLQLQSGGGVTLSNGPRTLYGKMQDLKKPLVLARKTGRSDPVVGDENRARSVLAIEGVVRRKAVFTARPQLSIEREGGA